MNKWNNYTLKQMMIAVCLARGFRRSEICDKVGCSESYITKLLPDELFQDLVKSLKNLQEDKDTKNYRGVGTLMMEVGRWLYSQGERKVEEQNLYTPSRS